VVTSQHSRCIHNRACSVEPQFVQYTKNKTKPLTDRDIEHIPMVLFRENRRIFTGGKCLEQPDGRATNVAGNESHPNALVLGQRLQIANKSISFPLRGPDLVAPPTRNEVWEIPRDLLLSRDCS
jgi:hypothetical protein